MKRILYDMGLWVVSRWPLERVLKLSHSLLVKRPPTPLKMEKNKFVLKCFLGHFECFKQLFFLVENWPILTPPLVENSTNFFKLRGGASMIAFLVGLLVCLSVCLYVKKILKLLKQRNLKWSWKQKMSARMSRPWISSSDVSLCLYVGRSTHILDHTYSWQHIPGALCSTLVVLVLIRM